jgi:hypothetical protein
VGHDVGFKLADARGDLLPGGLGEVIVFMVEDLPVQPSGEVGDVHTESGSIGTGRIDGRWHAPQTRAGALTDAGGPPMGSSPTPERVPAEPTPGGVQGIPIGGRTRPGPESIPPDILRDSVVRQAFTRRDIGTVSPSSATEASANAASPASPDKEP